MMKLIHTALATFALSSCFSFGEMTFYLSANGQYTKTDPKDLRGGASFTVSKSKAGKILEVKRSFCGCGSWGLTLKYTYNDSGVLVKIVSDYCTSFGSEEGSEEFKATNCFEEFKIVGKKVKLVTRKLYDAETGNKVDRGIPGKPLIAHWTHVSEIPVVK